MDRKRILSNYIKYHFLADFIFMIILLICITSHSYYWNYAKLFIIFKLRSISKIDQIYQRSLQTHRFKKTVYIIIRILIIDLSICNIIGLIFYAIDHYILTNGIFAPDCKF
jgi:hypothetical protein